MIFDVFFRSSVIRFGQLGRVLEKLTRPAAILTDLDEQRRARLLAVMLLLLLIASAVLMLLVALVQQAWDVNPLLFWASWALIGGMYLLSRTRNYPSAARVAIIIITAYSLLEAHQTPFNVSLLAFMVTAILLSSMTLRLRETIFFSGLQVLGMLWIANTVPPAELAHVFILLVFLTTTSMLVVIIGIVQHYYRRQINHQTENLLQAQERIHQSEARFRAATEGSLDAFFLLQSEPGPVANFRFTYANRQAEALLGRPGEPLIGRRVQELGLKPNIFDFLEQAQAVLTSRTTLADEIPLLSADNRLTWLQYQIVPVDNGVAVTCRDITDRKHNEDQLIDLAAALDQQKRMLDQILSSTPVYFHIYDLKGRYLYANKSFVDFIGRPLPALVGKTWRELDFSSAVGEQFDQDFKAVIETRQPVQDTFQMSFPDGGRFYETILIPVWDNSASMTSVIATVSDITARKQSEQQRLELAVERERVKTLQDLIQDTSHDLRTPLATLNTTLYLLKRLVANPERWEHHTGVLEAQVVYLTQLLDDLVNTARLEKTEFYFTLLDVNAVLERVVGEHYGVAQRKNQMLTFVPGSQIPALPADEVKLFRAVTNLVSNALKYTPEGGSVTVKSACVNGKVELLFEDTGIGISPNDLPFIFERFYRGLDTQSEGRGLGLAITKHIIQAHGGSIEVESVVGKGSLFRVLLPLDSIEPIL
ncbi:MAG TPA: PAS domain-containing protein [Phototrophicaceae bacterium]|nr:PAS domain-containing protein [Phototrophicaceae bacterium]